MLNYLFSTPCCSGPLILRLILATVIFPHGAQKVLGWFGGNGFEGTIGFFEQQLGIPAFLTVLVMMAEFLGSLALVAGFFTRIMAVAIGMVMLGAIFIVHLPNGFFMNWYGNQQGEGVEFHLLALGIAAALVNLGGGRFSIDRIISNRTHLGS